MSCVIAIDAGTTGVRSRAIFNDGRTPISSYQEFTQYFPHPGWVEHDAEEIWAVTLATLKTVLDQIDTRPTAIGITNQRETLVAWSKNSDKVLAPAIVWQDRRTAHRCVELSPHLDLVRRTTGLVLDPYFSGTKAEWLLKHGGVAASSDLAFGTVDSWILWRLTGGTTFATDASNASRTMLFDITKNAWSKELCDLLGVPISSLPEVRPSSGRFGVTGFSGLPTGIPISGIAGDQQASLFGQACFSTGSAKNTYGTGSFVLMNVGTTCPPPTDGLLNTIAWNIGDVTTYAVEGAIFATGAAVQWLRDGLEIIGDSAEVEGLATSVDGSDGVVVVPAFAGLGSPWWDAEARGAIFGLTRGTTRAHIARATLESIVFQTRDVMTAMHEATGVSLTSLRVDGGAASNDFLMQLQADHIGVTVLRAKDRDTTALGAAFLAGLAEGVWSSLSEIADQWESDRAFIPTTDHAATDASYEQWLRAVERTLTRN